MLAEPAPHAMSSTPSKGRRSAWDVCASHQTSGEPVWTAANSSQLKAMAMLVNPDFILQDEYFVSAWFPDFARVSSKFSILSEIETVEHMRSVFWGACPNILLVHAADHLDDLLEYVRKIMRLLTTVARLDIILYSRSSAVDSVSFLTNAMCLKHQMPFMPERIGQVDRLLGSTMDKQTGQKISGSGGSSTPASMVPEAWGPCKSVFLTNVPPYWKQEVLHEVLLTHGTGRKDFVLDKCQFHIGDIRTETWMATGPTVAALLGKVLQASKSATVIVPISTKEYGSKKAQIQGRDVLSEVTPMPLVSLADHNSIMVPADESAKVPKEISSVARERKSNILAHFSLDDVWVRVHEEIRGGSVKGFTHMACERRIDRIHVQPQCSPFIRSTYLVTTPADHKAVVLQLGPEDGPEGPPRFRFPMEMLEDEAANLCKSWRS